MTSFVLVMLVTLMVLGLAIPAMAENRTDQVILPNAGAALVRPVGDGTTTDFGGQPLVESVQGTGAVGGEGSAGTGSGSAGNGDSR